MRFAESGDDKGPLVVHHVIGPTELDTPPLCASAPIKRAVVDEEGILRLVYWNGNDRLKTRPVPVRLVDPADADPGSRMRMIESPFDTTRGLVIGARFEIQEPLLKRIAIGDAARVRSRTQPDKVMAGHVLSIGMTPRFDAQRGGLRCFPVWVALDEAADRASLLMGGVVDVTVLGRDFEDVLAIPRDLLGVGKGEPAVFIRTATGGIDRVVLNGGAMVDDYYLWPAAITTRLDIVVNDSSSIAGGGHPAGAACDEAAEVLRSGSRIA